MTAPSPARLDPRLPIPQGAVKLAIHLLIQTRGNAEEAARLLRGQAATADDHRCEVLATLIEEAAR